MKKCVVIPAYKVFRQIAAVIRGIPPSIDHIIVVDDACPEASGTAASKSGDKRVIVLNHGRNTGVGGAVVTGYKKGLELGCDIMVKIDGDGQMDPSNIDQLLMPIIDGKADYTKGNRFRDFHTLPKMPKLRLFGNSCLSFLLKIASGYWDIMDPTNGFTAAQRIVFEEINLDKLSKGYFFESDMLISLNIANAVVKDVAFPTEYGTENSSLKIWKVLLKFPFKILKGFLKRIFFKYFIYDFNMASVYIVLGIPLFTFGCCWGVYEWAQSSLTGIIRSPGTIMIIALPIIISFQMLTQAISIDIQNTPKK